MTEIVEWDAEKLNKRGRFVLTVLQGVILAGFGATLIGLPSIDGLEDFGWIDGSQAHAMRVVAAIFTFSSLGLVVTVPGWTYLLRKAFPKQ